MSIEIKPKRIQRKRTRGFRLAEATDNPNGVVYVGRPTKWGNPWSVKDALESGMFKPEYAHEVVAKEFRAWLTREVIPNDEQFGIYKRIILQKAFIRRNLHTLKGKDLACWCNLETPCHADILLELANKE